MKIFISIFLGGVFVCLASLSNSVLANKSLPADHRVYIDQEMRLFNVYLQNIKSELKHKEPQTDALGRLSLLMLDTAYQINKSKRGQVFHSKFNALLDDVKLLQKLAASDDQKAAIAQAKVLQNKCLQCHGPKGTQKP